MQIKREEINFWATPEDASPCATFQGELNADIAIIGGGISGLSAAYYLKKECPTLKIILLEAGQIGCGASGRNTGILGPGIAGTILDLNRRFGSKKAKKMYQATIDAVDTAKKLIQVESLECNLENVAQLRVARTERQAKNLQKQVRMLHKFNFEASYLDKTMMGNVISVPYQAGLCYPQSCLINPIQFCRELKRVLLSYGVQIYEHSAVRSIHPEQPAKLILEKGTISAQKVVLATNGYTPQLGLYQSEIIPLHTHIILTEPLNDRQLASLGWSGREAISESQNFFNYYRLTPENRLMFGGGRPIYQVDTNNRKNGATDIAEPKIWSKQMDEFRHLFPTLADVRFAQYWSGTMGFTWDMLPIIGFLPNAENILFVGGWNGHGVALGIASGISVVEALTDPVTKSSSLPWVRNRAPKFVRNPWRSLAMFSYLTGLDLLDRLSQKKRPR